MADPASVPSLISLLADRLDERLRMWYIVSAPVGDAVIIHVASRDQRARVHVAVHAANRPAPEIPADLVAAPHATGLVVCVHPDRVTVTMPVFIANRRPMPDFTTHSMELVVGVVAACGADLVAALRDGSQ